MQAANGKESGGGIRHKLGSLFSPRGTPPVVRGREDVDHGIFITADVLRVSVCVCVERERGVCVRESDCGVAVAAGVGTRSAHSAQSAGHERTDCYCSL